ncbi:MAG: hypothetical protein KC615_15355 [Anaerolineae bacterium]|nr:hypothetical protein [Anaerolineae bacterium]
MNVPVQKSVFYMLKWGALLGLGLGALAGIITAVLIGMDIASAIMLGLVFGGAFGLVAGLIMGTILGMTYGFVINRIYDKLDFNSLRIGLTLLGGVGTAAMATRIELLSGLLPEYAYIIVAGVAAGLTSYRYVSWYHQQRSTKFKNKAARASSSRLADVSREHNNALSDDLLQYQDGIQSQR